MPPLMHSHRPRLKGMLRIAMIAAFYCLLLLGGAYLGNIIRDLAGIEFGTIHAPDLKLMILGTAFIFALASALPFVPGAEIGIGMLILLGGTYAPLVYVCMLFALMLAFSVGRFIPFNVLDKAFKWLNLRRSSDLMHDLADRSPEQRMARLLEKAPRRIVPVLLRYRYLALIVVVNTPGNSLLGGGGGIALMAGMSGLFKWHFFAASIALAIAPIPIAFYLAI